MRHADHSFVPHAFKDMSIETDNNVDGGSGQDTVLWTSPN